MDEAIPDEVKKRLLRPILPMRYHPIPPPRMKRERKRKAIEALGPIKSPNTPLIDNNYQKEILDILPDYPQGLVFHQTQWVIEQYLRGWQMDVPTGNMDPRVFLEEVRPQIKERATGS